MAVKVLRVFQEFTSAGYVPMPIAGNIDYGVTVANTFPTTTPATFQTDDPDIEVDVTEVTDFYVWIRSHGTAWNYLYTRNVRVYPDSPTINNVVMGIIIARLTDAVPYTGATQDTDLGEFGLKAGWLGLDLTPTNTPTDVGTIYWDDQDGTANLVLKGGNVNLQIGQEQVTRVVNKTGASLLEANYQAVRISGAQGNRLKVSLAQANNDANSADTIGLVTETIANNEEGFVTTSGLVKGINTTGSLQSETWVDGDVLYLSGTTAGMITNVKPQAPTHTVIIGYVVRAHATQGQIYVKVDNGYELDELHNVRITTPTDKDFLIYDGTNQYWKNRDLFGTTGYLPVYDTTSLLKDSIIYTDGTAIGIGTNVLQSGAVATFGDVAHFTENISLADSKGIVSGGVNMLSRNNLNNQIIIGADGGINDNVAFYAGDLERMRLLANGRLAINKTTASYQVDVQGDVNVSGAFRVNGTIIPNGTVTSVAMSVPTGLVISGSPITSSGTLAVTYAVNYGIPTLTKQSDWDDAYTWVTNFPDQLGNAGKFLTTNGSVLSWASLVTGVSSVFGRTGAVTAQSGDYTTAQVTESGNLYYTDARARLALSGGTGITYNNTTGVIAYSGTVYTDSSIRALFSAGAGISYNNTTGVITSTITQYTDAMARASLSFVAGSGAYNSTTGVITIPTNTNQLTNGASFITLASLSASAPLSYNNGTGAFSISQASGSTNGFLSSTDWNTFNNKQNALGYTPVPTTRTLTINGTSYDLSADRSWTIASGIGGSGTTYYIPKFTASTTIGNSNLQEVSGNLGLGVTPSAWGTYNAYQVANASLWGAINNAYVGANYYFNGSNRVYIATGYATEFAQVNGEHRWYTAPSGTAGNAISFTQAMTLNASGNLGIGITNPDEILTLNRASSLYARIVNTSNSVSTYWGVNGTEIYFGSSSNSPVTFYSNSTERMRINAGGNVSIGNTNNTYKLDVNNVGAGVANTRIYGNDQANVRLRLENAGAGGRTYEIVGGLAGANNSSFSIFDATASSTRLQIDSTGAATFSSSVTANGNASTTPAVIYNNANGASGTAQYYANYTSGATVIGRIFRGNGLAGTVGNGLNIDNYDGFQVRLNQLGGTGGSFNIMGGNVGIGTTSPSNGLLVINSTSATGVRFALESSGTMNGIVALGNNAISGLSTTDMALWTRGVMAFETGASGEKMRLDASGNLMVATTSASNSAGGRGNITIGGSSTSILNFQIGGSLAAYLYHDNNNLNILNSKASGALLLSTNSSEQMRITSAGNVGIGISSPSQKFEVKFSNSLVNYEGYYSTTDYVVQRISGGASGTGAYTQYSDGVTYNFAIGTTTGGDFTFFNNRYPTNAGSELMRITKTGNVGIGSSSPNQKLSIDSGTSTASYLQFTAGSTTGTASTDGFHIGIDSTGKAIINQRENLSFGISTNNTERVLINNSGIITITGNMRFYYANSPAYVIQLPNDINDGQAIAYAWVAYSDARVKKNVSELNYGIDSIMKLKPVSYNHHSARNDQGKIDILEKYKYEIGFIAQEVYNVIPEVVNPGNDLELWGMNYERLTSVIVKGMQEQQVMIETNAEKIARLEKETSILKEEIKQLKGVN